MAIRKKWRIVYPGSPDIAAFTSERKAYEFVEGLRAAWVAGGPTGSLMVQVDEGTGYGW